MACKHRASQVESFPLDRLPPKTRSMSMALVCSTCKTYLPIGEACDHPPEVAWETVAFQVAEDVRSRRSFDYIEERLTELGVESPIARWQFWEGMRQAAAGSITPAALRKILEKLHAMGKTVPGGDGAPDPAPDDGVVAYAAGDLAHRIYMDRHGRTAAPAVTAAEFAA